MEGYGWGLLVLSRYRYITFIALNMGLLYWGLIDQCSLPGSHADGMRHSMDLRSSCGLPRSFGSLTPRVLSLVAAWLSSPPWGAYGLHYGTCLASVVKIGPAFTMPHCDIQTAAQYHWCPVIIRYNPRTALEYPNANQLAWGHVVVAPTYIQEH